MAPSILGASVGGASLRGDSSRRVSTLAVSKPFLALALLGLVVLAVPGTLACSSDGGARVAPAGSADPDPMTPPPNDGPGATETNFFVFRCRTDADCPADLVCSWPDAGASDPDAPGGRCLSRGDD
jgi:hypothetical protein